MPVRVGQNDTAIMQSRLRSESARTAIIESRMNVDTESAPTDQNPTNASVIQALTTQEIRPGFTRDRRYHIALAGTPV